MSQAEIDCWIKTANECAAAGEEILCFTYYVYHKSFPGGSVLWAEFEWQSLQIAG